MLKKLSDYIEDEKKIKQTHHEQENKHVLPGSMHMRFLRRGVAVAECVAATMLPHPPHSARYVGSTAFRSTYAPHPTPVGRDKSGPYARFARLPSTNSYTRLGKQVIPFKSYAGG